MTDAQIAFEQSLRMPRHDHEHIEDYASALDAYAELYGDWGQLDVAAPMA